MIKLIITFIFLITNISYASCNKDVTYLKKDSKAPCTGYLFSEEKEAEVRIKIQSYDYLEKFSNKQTELINNYDNQIDVLEQKNNLLLDRINDKESKNFWENTAYFILGAVITGYIAGQVGSNGQR